MMNKRSIYLIVGILLILFGGALMTIFYSSVHSKGDIVTNEYKTRGDFKTICIKNTSWRVNLESDDVNVTTVQIKGDERFTPSVNISNGTLTINLSYDSDWWSATPYLLGAEVTITVPQKVYENIEIVSASGRAHVEDVESKNMKISTGSGRVELEDVLIKDAFKVVSASGSVIFEDFDAGSIDIRTASGRVNGSLYSGKVFTVKTASGHVNVPDSTPGGSCYIQTASGSVSISVVK